MVVAGGSGLYLGFRAHRSSERLTAEHEAERRSSATFDLTSETNRMLLELWRMEDVERQDRMVVPRPLGWKELGTLAPPSARVLVVEDDLGVRRGLERILAALGYEVRGTGSAEEADHWLSAERLELMLLDIELPRMKGVEFLSWALERDRELAVVMLTGLDDPELAIQCLELGARTYLVKPIETDFLRLALRDALAVRRLLLERNARVGS